MCIKKGERDRKGRSRTVLRFYFLKEKEKNKRSFECERAGDETEKGQLLLMSLESESSKLL